MGAPVRIGFCDAYAALHGSGMMLREIIRHLDRERFDNFGNGPRSTPAVSAGLVFALGAQGKLVAVDEATGRVRWKHDLVEDFGGKVPQWGIASSPAIEGEKLLHAVGAAGSSLMAFDKTTGELVHEISIDKAPGGGPMTYIAGGRQFLVIPVGNRGEDQELLAYALPATDG